MLWAVSLHSFKARVCKFWRVLFAGTWIGRNEKRGKGNLYRGRKLGMLRDRFDGGGLVDPGTVFWARLRCILGTLCPIQKTGIQRGVPSSADFLLVAL